MQRRWAFALIILSALIGSLYSTGAAAALAFPTVKKLGVIVPAWPTDPRAWMLVAGLPLQKSFMMNDWVTALGLLAVVLLILPRQADLKSSPRIWAWVTVGGAAALLLAEFFLHARMDRILSDIQIANVAGLETEATANHNAFSKLHPIATGLMAARFLCLVLACFAILLVVTPRHNRTPVVSS